MLRKSKTVRNKIRKLSESTSIVNTLFFITSKNSINIKFDKDNRIARLIGFFQMSIF